MMIIPSKYGNWLYWNNWISTTAVGLLCNNIFWFSVAVNNSGFNVSYNPPFERKSGIPEGTDTPAP